MKRVEEYELWEKNKRRQMAAVRTQTKPAIFFLPKDHNDSTMTALEETMDAIEKEIADARESFEEDLLKIEAKVTSRSKVRLLFTDPGAGCGDILMTRPFFDFPARRLRPL